MSEPTAEAVRPEVVHPAAALDEVVHQRARLGVLSILAEADDADFSYLRRSLGLTDGNLGRHLEVLVAAGYLELRKGYDGRRNRTWASITPRGRQALLAELTVLRALVTQLELGAGES